MLRALDGRSLVAIPGNIPAKRVTCNVEHSTMVIPKIK